MVVPFCANQFHKCNKLDKGCIEGAEGKPRLAAKRQPVAPISTAGKEQLGPPREILIDHVSPLFSESPFPSCFNFLSFLLLLSTYFQKYFPCFLRN